MKKNIVKPFLKVCWKVQRAKLLICAVGVFLAAVANGFCQPAITSQPTNQSVSLGASASFEVSATTSHPPLLYQWRLASKNLVSATNSSLVLTNIQLGDAGDYDVVVADTFGPVTSQAAHLEVDPTFTKITAGPIVNDAGNWKGCAWGDYDNDGFIDLFITSPADANGSFQMNALYRNNGNGTFTRVATDALVGEAGDWQAAAWADYDDDGHLDLFVTRADGSGFPDQVSLYRNNGDGTFTEMTLSILGNSVPGGSSLGCAWADYDRDGFLDMYVARAGTDWLLHNNGDGTFASIADLAGTPPNTQDNFFGMWGDYDNDDWPDLFVDPNFLYHNNGDGTFTPTSSGGGIWVDYDNDGNLDAFGGDGSSNALYHNNGDGNFTADNGIQVPDNVWATWGDYDNDGFVDLFLTSSGTVNSLFHNNGNGTFTRVLSGSLVNDEGLGLGCAWGDYDNDGFLDLVVVPGGIKSSTNLLYRNNGNSNGWIKLRLVGTVSNRSAIGAKVRVKATVRGRTLSQMREINSEGFGAGPLEAHFGLGDATNIDLVRIEWPSGIVQTLTNLPPRQFLTVVEHQDNAAGPIIFTGIARAADGAVSLSVSGKPGVFYLFEGSTNLVNWSKLGVRTNATGTVDFLDSSATNLTARFYRASAP